MAVVSTSSFLLEDDCPAPAPCSCQGSLINCEFGNLKSIPAFRNTSLQIQSSLVLNFTGNSISGIPANAFKVMKSINAFRKEIVIDLSNNALTSTGIDPDAFMDTADKITYLDLRNNNLTEIPATVSKLVHLETLYLENNPIASINMNTLKPIHPVLRSLSISFTRMNSWPSALHQLTALEYLKVTDMNFNLPVGAFDGFKSTLKQLIFQRPTFNFIPPAVCDLHALQILNVTEDELLTDKRIVHCNPAISSVNFLMFNHDTKITYFPDFFESFPRVVDIFINDSKIEFIDDTSITQNAYLLRLTITHNELSTIPGAINKFTALVFLDLHSNQIRSIESNSFYKPTPSSRQTSLLTHLDLSKNPIVYISASAFSYLSALKFLNLRNTHLNVIPEMIKTLTALEEVNLQRNQITCNCDDAAWLKTWASSHTSVTVYGFCEPTHEAIFTFINTSLPHCP